MNATSPPVADLGNLSLLARSRNHDADAWLQIVKWIGPFILSWCREVGLQAADCDAVAAQVVDDLWRGLASFHPDRSQHSFRRWVYSVASNRIGSLARQRPGLRSLPNVETAVGDSSPRAQDWTRRALQLLLRDFAAQYGSEPGFRAFHRTAVDGLPVAAAAQELGQTAWGVRQHRLIWLGRLRGRLRIQFGELLD